MVPRAINDAGIFRCVRVHGAKLDGVVSTPPPTLAIALRPSPTPRTLLERRASRPPPTYGLLLPFTSPFANRTQLTLEETHVCRMPRSEPPLRTNMGGARAFFFVPRERRMMARSYLHPRSFLGFCTPCLQIRRFFSPALALALPARLQAPRPLLHPQISFDAVTHALVRVCLTIGS